MDSFTPRGRPPRDHPRALTQALAHDGNFNADAVIPRTIALTGGRGLRASFLNDTGSSTENICMELANAHSAVLGS